jgi:hypothetical protein
MTVSARKGGERSKRSPAVMACDGARQQYRGEKWPCQWRAHLDDAELLAALQRRG